VAGFLLVFVTTAYSVEVNIPKQFRERVEALKKEKADAEIEELARINDDSYFEPGTRTEAIQASGEVSTEATVSAVEDAPKSNFLLESVEEAEVAAVAFNDQLAADEGLVSGQVIDKDTGEPVSGVAIVLEGTDAGTITDREGQYTLGPIKEGIYTLTFLKAGYIEANVTEYAVVGEKVNVFPFALPPRPAEMSDEVYELQDFTVTAQEANDLMQKLEFTLDASSITNILSSEDFSKFAASDLGDAVKRVSGVSVVGGKYAVIRGLGDRYVSTTLNGLPITSPDPDKQAVQLDLFPSALFDGLSVTKTYTPDQDAISTGGIDLRIKDLPNEFFLKGSISAGFNSVATENENFLTSGGVSKRDKYVDGARDRVIPEEVKGNIPVVPPLSRVNDFLAGLIGFPFITQAEYDLALAETTRLAQLTGTNNHSFGLAQGPNIGLKISAGDRYQLEDYLGISVFGGLNYGRKANLIEDGRYFRSATERGGTFTLSPENFVNPNVAIGYEDLTFNESTLETTLSWLLGGGVVFGTEETHKIRAHRMSLKIGEDTNTVYRGGYFNENSENDPPLETGYYQAILYTQRELLSDQVLGSHSFEPNSKFIDAIDFSWGIGQETAIQDQPNYLQVELRELDDGRFDLVLDPNATLNDNPSIYKIWRYIEENSFKQRYDLDFKSEKRKGFATSVQFGAAFSESDRSVFDEFVTLSKAGNSTLDDVTELDDLILLAYDVAADIDLNTETKGYYFKVDQSLFERYKFVFGARLQENIADVQVNGADGTVLRGAGANNPLSDLPREGGYNVEDWYPSFTFIADLTDSFQVRFAYSDTIALPSARESSPYASSAFSGSEVDVGNSSLQPSRVENKDIGFSYSTQAGDLFRLTYFEKLVSGRIEKLNGLFLDDPDTPDFTYSANIGASLFTWYNNPSDAELNGVEIEVRKNLGFLGSLFEPFSVGGNYTVIDGVVRRTQPEIDRKLSVGRPVSEKRPLTEQPESILNFDLSYDNPDYGLKFSIIYYSISDVLEAVSLDDSYDIYRKSYSTLDFTCSKELNDNFKISFSAKNLLNTEYESFYEVEGNEVTSDFYERGITYSFSISADF